MPYHDRLSDFATAHGVDYIPLCDLVDEIVQEQLRVVVDDYVNRLRKSVVEVTAMTSLNYVPTTRRQLALALSKVIDANPELSREDLAAKIGWSLSKLERIFPKVMNGTPLPPAAGESSGGAERTS